MRELEDSIVVPRVLGHAVGLSPLVVLVSVTSIGILLGGFYVLLAIPVAAVIATVVDVIVRNEDPAEPGRTNGAVPREGRRGVARGSRAEVAQQSPTSRHHAPRVHR